MAQLVLSAAGAAAGFALGGATGAQLGWALGSLVGSSLGPGTQGPRLSETKIQISSYGAALGIVYGGMRRAGNVIWSSDLIESESEEGGKGGPSITTFSYSVSCAVAICEGVQGGVRRVWADAKLVYDIREEADAGTQAASAQFGAHMVFYSGDDTQMPDPTIEAVKGVGTVAAYRGTCYVVFTSLPVGDYGNRIPNFTFELTNETPAAAPSADIQPALIYPWEVVDGKPQHSKGGDMQYVVQGVEGSGLSYTTDNLADAIVYMGGVSAIYTEYLGYYTSAVSTLSIYGQETGIFSGYGPADVFLCFNSERPDFVVYDGLTPSGSLACGSLNNAGAAPSDGFSYMFSSLTPRGPPYPGDGNAGVLKLLNHSAVPPAGYNSINNCTNYAPDLEGYFPVVYESPHFVIRVTRLPTVKPLLCLPGSPTPDEPAQLPGNEGLCLYIDGRLSTNYAYTKTAGNYMQLSNISLADGGYEQIPRGPIVVLGDPLATNAAFWNAAALAAGVAGSYELGTFPVSSTVAGIGAAEVYSVPPGSIPLSAIVADVCTRAGLAEEQIDVSALTDPVFGYQITRQGPARGFVEPLRQAYWFDGVESGSSIRFVKRGAPAVTLIPYEALGAGEDEAGELSEAERTQETELPSTVNVAYPAIVADFQAGTQSARRMTTGSQQVQSVEVAVALDDQRAAEIASVLLYDLWTARTQRRITLPRAYARLEPTDVVSFDDHEFIYHVRVIDKDEDGQVVKLLVRDEDPAAYSPHVEPSFTSGAGDSMRVEGPTRIELLDVPLLRDQDDGYGFYAAAAGYLPGWRGAGLFKSDSGGTSYASVIDLRQTATLGAALTALAPFVGGNTVDEQNSVDVRLQTGVLASVTREQMLNDANAAVLGDEILQFQRATLVADGVYRLTGLLRGRRGTEQYTGTHATGERFVYLDPARIVRVGDSLALINQPALYKAVTYGQALADAIEVGFTDTGASVKPLSPVHVAAFGMPDGSILLRWTRRTRIDGVWRDSVDVPLGESSESYRVDIYDSPSHASIVRSIIVGEPQASYTAPMQVADFGAPVTALYATVRQLSALVGDGFATSVELSGVDPGASTVGAASVFYAGSETEVVSLIDTRVSGAIIYKGMLPDGVGEPNSWILGDAMGRAVEITSSSIGWKIGVGASVVITSTGFVPGGYNSGYGNVAVFLAGAGIFERLEWRGTGGPRSIPHAIGVAPALAFAKSSAIDKWWMYSAEAGAGQSMRFPESTGVGDLFAADADAFPDLSTGSMFKVGADLNAAGLDYLAFVFSGSSSSVSAGTYVGNGLSAGVAVSLGFLPEVLFLRALDGVALTFITVRVLAGSGKTHWFIDDRGTSPASTPIVALDADGFRPVSAAAAVNASGVTYQYWALRP